MMHEFLSVSPVIVYVHYLEFRVQLLFLLYEQNFLLFEELAFLSNLSPKK